ncbi:MAG: DUF1284 domain-containing protein [Candidatus Dojkabacteria bacterium]|jgi:hypothetical protein|nr:DUF1284 domain-containing protein [Candidatus Dojkabacteria bacterium]
MKLRIHHFFDIIKDFGSRRKLTPHSYGHSYHIVAQKIQVNPETNIKIVLGTDDICKGCKYIVNNHCEDTILHREDFTSKEKFNDHIDKRILKKCNIIVGDILTPVELCEKIPEYLDHIFWIYEGNNIEHTQVRK